MLRLLSLLAVFVPVHGLFYERFEDLPVREFDFIVVGGSSRHGNRLQILTVHTGGTAGNVVANRLTEDADIRVLVLEAGGSDEDAYNSRVPLYAFRLQGSQYDWNFTTTPQAALNDRAIPYPRGFIIGGSSSINVMLYTRGPSEDWDRMAWVTGDSGWTWNSIQPYIRKVNGLSLHFLLSDPHKLKNERFVPPADHHNTTGQFDPKVHSFDGVNSVSLPGWQYSSDPRVFEAIAQSDGEFPFNEDMNSGFQLGFGWAQSTIGEGTRSSSATSYLGPKYIERKNLFVLLHARVLRLKQTNTKFTGANLAVRGIELTQDTGNTIHALQASKEVILSAGSVGTPTILMHSGIGDPTELKTVGIKPLHDLPSVGKNLTDHPLLVTAYNANTTDTPDDILRNETFARPFERRWNETKTGPLSTQGRILGWFRFNLSSPVFGGVPDPAAGPNSAHFEIIIGNGAGIPPPIGHYLGLTVAVVTPTSTGSLKLNSSNPFDAPLINPNVLGTDFDFTAMREAFFASKRFASAPAWDGYIISPTVNVTDDNLDDFIRNNTGVVWHPVKTAAMSARDADYGVVDPDLKVKGLDGLRIVDASVLATLHSECTHTSPDLYHRGTSISLDQAGL
ncbi:Aryl-alcohol oxidase [Mycena venus]|uniref:Aryl-alcohol oxidase n=1 Tax=Mycena venus TaxID=2733690 RepID=A0A8H6XXB8_9AGAR|nr:Aryl-alcohol oxidase [Mycena venus]